MSVTRPSSVRGSGPRDYKYDPTNHVNNRPLYRKWTWSLIFCCYDNTCIEAIASIWTFSAWCRISQTWRGHEPQSGHTWAKRWDFNSL